MHEIIKDMNLIQLFKINNRIKLYVHHLHIEPDGYRHDNNAQKYVAIQYVCKNGKGNLVRFKVKKVLVSWLHVVQWKCLHSLQKALDLILVEPQFSPGYNLKPEKIFTIAKSMLPAQ